MSEEQEVETRDIQESLEEHIEDDLEKKAHWTRYVALTTAGLAAFAAVGSLESGGLSNEALTDNIKAADTWNEYQASRTKSHLYTVQASTMLDLGVVAAPPRAKPVSVDDLTRKPQGVRLRGYLDQVAREDGKAKDLSKVAKKLETESEHKLHSHHLFAYSVALLQVGIALGAVSALARSKPIWLVSGIIGILGTILFVMGFLR